MRRGDFEQLKRKHMQLLFSEFKIPLTHLEPLLDYTGAIDHFIYFYLFQYRKDKDNFQKLKDWLGEMYEIHYKFSSNSIYQLLISIGFLSKISFTLFANLCYCFKVSPYKVRQDLMMAGLIKESEGYYKVVPFFKEYLIKIREQNFSRQRLRKIKAILIENIKNEKIFLPEYLLLADSPKDTIHLENQFTTSIKNKTLQQVSPYLKNHELPPLKNQGLDLFIRLSKETYHLKPSLVYLIHQFKKHPLYKNGLKHLIYLFGKQCQLTDSFKAVDYLENQYYRLIANWLWGKKGAMELSHDFLESYGVFHVPDFQWLNNMEAVCNPSFNIQLALTYKYYLSGRFKAAKKAFYQLLKTHKSILTTDYRSYYFFILSQYYYQKEKYKKSIWYLEQCFLIVKNRNEPIFCLKIFSFYLRILYLKKEMDPLKTLLKRAKKYLPNQKPFMAFIHTLRGIIYLLENDFSKGLRCLEKAFSYYLSVNDIVNALDIHLLVLFTQGKHTDLETLKENLPELLDKGDYCVLKNTALLHHHLFKTIKVAASYFNQRQLAIGRKDCSSFCQGREKLESLLYFLLFKLPEPVSREAIKRVFWKNVDVRDRDANLRVALSTLNKFFKDEGMPSFFVSKGGYLYLKEGYEIQSDIKEFILLFKRGRKAYRDKDYSKCKKYFKTLLRTQPVLFEGKEGSWEQLLKKDVEIMIKYMEKHMLGFSKEKGNWEAAEKYCRRLYEKDSAYGVVLQSILEKNKVNTKKDKDYRSEEKSFDSKVFEKIIFPFN